jgi:hypothetical protein
VATGVSSACWKPSSKSPKSSSSSPSAWSAPPSSKSSKSSPKASSSLSAWWLFCVCGWSKSSKSSAFSSASVVVSVLGWCGRSDWEVFCDSCELRTSEGIRTLASCWSSCGLGDRDLSLGVGDAFFVKHEGLVWGGGRVNSWSGVLTLKRGT